MRGGGLRCIRAALAGTDRHNRAVITVFPATFPDGMTPADPYGPGQALLDGLPFLVAVVALGLLVAGSMSLFEIFRPLRRALEGELLEQWDEMQRERLLNVVRFFAIAAAIPLALSGYAAVRMAPADAVTSSTWSYEGEASVVEASGGRRSWVKLALPSGQQVVLNGVSPSDLNEELDMAPWGVAMPVAVRCQAWHSWLPPTGGYVSAWCENPRFGEE
jgi:hypothetical protein